MLLDSLKFTPLQAVPSCAGRLLCSSRKQMGCIITSSSPALTGMFAPCSTLQTAAACAVAAARVSLCKPADIAHLLVPGKTVQ